MPNLWHRETSTQSLIHSLWQLLYLEIHQAQLTIVFSSFPWSFAYALTKQYYLLYVYVIGREEVVCKHLVDLCIYREISPHGQESNKNPTSNNKPYLLHTGITPNSSSGLTIPPAISDPSNHPALYFHIFLRTSGVRGSTGSIST